MQHTPSAIQHKFLALSNAHRHDPADERLEPLMADFVAALSEWTSPNHRLVTIVRTRCIRHYVPLSLDLLASWGVELTYSRRPDGWAYVCAKLQGRKEDAYEGAVVRERREAVAA